MKNSAHKLVIVDTILGAELLQILLRGTMRQSLLDTGQLVERDIRVDEWGQYEKVSLINAMTPLGCCVCEVKPTP